MAFFFKIIQILANVAFRRASTWFGTEGRYVTVAVSWLLVILSSVAKPWRFCPSNFHALFVSLAPARANLINFNRFPSRSQPLVHEHTS